MIFQYFSRQIYFSRTFPESPLNSSTFQACVNPVNDKFNFNFFSQFARLAGSFYNRKIPENPTTFGRAPYQQILNTFHFLFSTKMLVFRAGIPKMLVRRANREDPDQTASSEAV